MRNRAEPVGNCDHRLFLEHMVNRFLNELLGNRIDRAGCLIQHYHFAATGNGASKSDQLTLPRRQVASIALQFKFILARQSPNKLIGVNVFRGIFNKVRV